MSFLVANLKIPAVDQGLPAWVAKGDGVRHADGGRPRGAQVEVEGGTLHAIRRPLAAERILRTASSRTCEIRAKGGQWTADVVLSRDAWILRQLPQVEEGWRVGISVLSLVRFWSLFQWCPSPSHQHQRLEVRSCQSEACTGSLHVCDPAFVVTWGV